MTEKHYFLCDECGKELAHVECAPNQLMFTLIANYDTSLSLGYINKGFGDKAHLCGQECLLKYVKKLKDHQDLPIKVEKEE